MVPQGEKWRVKVSDQAEPIKPAEEAVRLGHGAVKLANSEMSSRFLLQPSWFVTMSCHRHLNHKTVNNLLTTVLLKST
jgi:hypothetical protein